MRVISNPRATYDGKIAMIRCMTTFDACAFGIAPSNNQQQPQKKPCNPSTRIAGAVSAIDGFITASAMANLAAVHFSVGAGLIGVTCFTPEPGEPLACAAGIAGGAALGGGGAVLGYGAYAVAKEEMIPGIKQAFTCQL